MRILFITTIDAETETNGGTIYTRTLLKLFRQTPDLEIIVVQCQNKAYNKRQKLLKLIGLALAGIFSSKPMKAFYFFNIEARDRIRKLSQDHFDFIVYDKLETLWARKYFTQKPDLLISQNLEYELQRDRIATYRSIFVRSLLRADTEKLRQFERKAFQDLGGVIFISAADQRNAGTSVGGYSEVIPPVFDIAPRPSFLTSHTREPSAELRPAFIGDLRWWPNRANLQWLIEQVLPVCNGAGLRVKLDVYGKGSESIESEYVDAHGFIPDINLAWSRCDFLAAPTLVGGGLNVKIAEAVSNGVPVVTTSKAAQAFEHSISECFMIADSPSEWLTLLTDITNKPEILEDFRIKTAAQAIAFSDAYNVKKLATLLSAVAQNRSSTVTGSSS